MNQILVDENGTWEVLGGGIKILTKPSKKFIDTRLFQINSDMQVLKEEQERNTIINNEMYLIAEAAAKAKGLI